MDRNKQDVRRASKAKRHEPRRRGASYARTLRLEPLETRHLLATLALDVRFLEDTNGDHVPAKEATGPLTVGQTFWVEVRVQDQRTPPVTPAPGVISLPLNVSWDSDAAQFAGPLPIPGTPGGSQGVPPDNPLVTNKFPQQRFVNADLNNRVFAGLRGMAVPNATPPIGESIGREGPERFSLLEFEAVSVGQVCFSTGLAGAMAFADAAVLDKADPASACIQIDAADQGSASLSGFVYVDANKDGRRNVEDVAPDDREHGLPGVEIQLYRDDVLVATDLTGPDGWYHFEDLPPGVYELRQANQPDCFLDGDESLGVVLPSGESRGAVRDDRFVDITLRAGDAGIDYNFGEFGLRAACINKGMLLSSADPIQSTIYEPLGVPSAVVRGTGGPDVFRVSVGPDAIRVAVNDAPPQLFPAAGRQIVSLDAVAGHDTVIVEGSAATELAHVEPDQLVYRDVVCYPAPSAVDRCEWTWAIEARGGAQASLDAGGGDDLVVLRDSSNDDVLWADQGRATIAVGDAELELLAFDRLRAFSTRGGHDTATLIGPLPLKVTLFGDWV